jgi:glycosyltransferase involved in cell wall biosynthesis
MLERLAQIATVFSRLSQLQNDVARLRYELDMLRSRNDVEDELVRQFGFDRLSPDYGRAYDDPKPLVSVCVGTFNRSRLLVERCLASLRAQTYENLEVIVVGDCCTDDTEDAVRRLNDSRIRFENLPRRGPYPDDPRLRWMVAGTMPVNHALSVARGEFLTHLDDDDEHAPDRIEKLLGFIRQTRADLVFHPFTYETRAGQWKLNEAREFRYSQVTTSSIFYHNWLRRIPWDVQAYLTREPGDWNRLRKIQYLGAEVRRFPEPLLRHFVERTQAIR